MMEPNLIKYKALNDDWMNEFVSKIGLREFCEIESRVYNSLDLLRSGRHYNIAEQVPEEQQELFIKFCCNYIDRHPEYEMSDDYCRIYNRSDRL